MDWQNLLLGSENWSFLAETLLRSFIMYLIILSSLRLVGKRGVTQLSVFELVIIIGLGSAAGDPMFYKDVGVLVGLMVFIVIIGSYLLTTYLVGKSDKLERMIEGKAIYLIQDGEFALENFEKEPLAHDEFFSELRERGVSHLGQLKFVISETTGRVSVFFYPDEQVKYGLPILPHLFNNHSKVIREAGTHSCIFCGHTEQLAAVTSRKCGKCEREIWVRSINDRRVT